MKKTDLVPHRIRLRRDMLSGIRAEAERERRAVNEIIVARLGDSIRTDEVRKAIKDAVEVSNSAMEQVTAYRSRCVILIRLLRKHLSDEELARVEVVLPLTEWEEEGNAK